MPGKLLIATGGDFCMGSAEQTVKTFHSVCEDLGPT